MRLYSQLRWVDNVKGSNSCLLCSTFAAHAHKQQTSHTTQDKKMKVDATLSNMTSAFPQLLGHTGTLTTFVIITGVSPHSGLRVIRPGPPSQTVLCHISHGSHIARTPKHWHRIPQIQRALNIECPDPVSQFSLWSTAADPVSPLPLSQVTPCLSYSHKHRPGLTSHTRPGHRAPSHRHTRLLHARRILRKNANKLADLHLVSPHELSHQHSRVMCGFAIGHAIVSNPWQLCWITTFHQLMFMTLEDAWIETFLMGMRSNDDRFFQTHTRVPFLDKEITGNTINIPTEVSCIVPLLIWSVPCFYPSSIKKNIKREIQSVVVVS